MNIREVSFLNLPLVTGGFNETADWLIQQVSDTAHPPKIISHINVSNYHTLSKNSPLEKQLGENCILFFDGIGLKLGAFLQGHGVLPDLNGTDLFPIVMEKMAKNGAKIFLLGASAPVVQKAAENLLGRHPDLKIVGFHHGYFSVEDHTSIVSQINESDADVLVVGMGFPRQEIFALENRGRLKARVVWNVGGLFDFISGEKPRAPRWLRQLRLEWLFRFTLEPGRMWYRIFVSTPWYFQHVIFEAILGTGLPRGKTRLRQHSHNKSRLMPWIQN